MRRQHLQALAAVHELKMNDLSLKIMTKGEHDTLDMTILNSSTKSGSLVEQLQQIRSAPLAEHKLVNIKVYSSKDGELALNIFTFAPRTEASAAPLTATPEDARHILRAAAEIRAGEHAQDPAMPAYDDALMSDESLTEYVSRCPPKYVQNSHPRRFLIQRALYDQVRGSDGAAVHIEKYRGSGGPPGGTAAWVTLAVGNAFPDELLALTADMLAVRGIDIWRAHMDNILDPESSLAADKNTEAVPGKTTLLRLLVSPNPLEQQQQQEGGGGAAASSVFGPAFEQKLKKDLKRCRWLDDSTLSLAYPKDPSKHHFGFAKAEVITALCSLMHGPLAKAHPAACASLTSITDIVTASPYLRDITEELAQVFLDKFQPGEQQQQGAQREQLDRAIEERLAVLQDRIDHLQFEEARLVLAKMALAIRLTLKTNVYNDDRYALALRVQPELLFTEEELAQGPKRKELPFGVFFSHGRYFNGFHNRFRDISRGGLRLVTPPNSEMKSVDSAKQFDECYGLSLGQQLKNKDIPEGGAKAVVLVDTPAVNKQYHEVLKRQSVRAFVDSLLDLTVRDDLFRRTVVDRYGEEEVIFLGPDEQVVPADIAWIIKHAAKRGYGIPSTFMSSKAEAGFNHKEYGVTSEGVAVFLDTALRETLQIDPRQDAFTIKITGGPDGDVAGNLLKILHREYGEKACVVGICDVDGVAEDPAGLHWGELLRLVHESKSVVHFDPALISPEGVCMRAADSDEAQARRNSMPFRVKADAFVPAGGRPNTISSANFRDFLDADGVPSSRLIVEGANIYVTNDARQLLFDTANVMIIKDSSANKCGVVTSSCEIACSMLLSTEEFVANKQPLVDDVLLHLRHIAQAEARMLYSCFRKYPGTLPQFSERISFCINSVTDALIARLDGLQPGDALLEELLPLVKLNLPPHLAALAWDRAQDRMPLQYQKNSIASTLGSLLVYREGIMLIESMPEERRGDAAIAYYRAMTQTDALVSRLEGCAQEASPEDLRLMLKLMKHGAARTAMELGDK
jgi:glutamate dehydrogenase